MCSTPPAMATSYAPNAMPDAVVVTAVIAPAHIRSIGEAGDALGQPGEQGGGAADGQALVADLGGGGDGHLVHALGRQRRVATHELADGT